MADDEIQELAEKRAWALEMGGAERVARRRARGRLTARERIDLLLDPDSFFEVGMYTHAPEPEWADRTPGDGVICGYGKIEGRTVAVSATDATVLGGSDGGEAAGRKNSRVMALAQDKGYPHIELGEGGGGRIHNLMGWAITRMGGGSGSGVNNNLTPEHRVPMLTAVLGNSYGGTSFRAGSSDWVVMTKGANMSISSPRLVEVSIGEHVDNDELGGSELHSQRTGQVDLVTDDEADVLAAIREIVGYLPSRASDPPPVQRTGDDPRRREEALLTSVPQATNRAFNMVRLIRHIVDDGKLTLIKPDFGQSAICGLARLDGHSVGVIGNDSRHQAGEVRHLLQHLQHPACLLPGRPRRADREASGRARHHQQDHGPDGSAALLQRPPARRHRPQVVRPRLPGDVRVICAQHVYVRLAFGPRRLHGAGFRRPRGVRRPTRGARTRRRGARGQIRGTDR